MLNNTNTNIICTFNMIIDTDLGLLEMIKEKYNNPKFIFSSYLDIPKPILQNLLINREKENILYSILKDEYINNADNILSQFLDQEYEDIINKSSKTSIYNLLKIYYKTNVININILCKNKYEEQLINKYNIEDKIKFNIVNEYNMKGYDSLFIKNYRDCLKFKNLIGKNIYVANYKFNFDETNSLLKEITSQIIDVNKISIIDIYNIKDNNVIG